MSSPSFQLPLLAVYLPKTMMLSDWISFVCKQRETIQAYLPMNDHFQNSIIDTMGHRNTRALGHSAMYVVDMVRIPGNKKGASFGGAHELSFRICTHKHLIKGACSIELKEVCFWKLLTKNIPVASVVSTNAVSHRPRASSAQQREHTKHHRLEFQPCMEQEPREQKSSGLSSAHP